MHGEEMQCNCQNFRILKKSGSRNAIVMSDLRVEVEILCNASSRNYRNSLVIVDLAMGQILPYVPQNVFLVIAVSYSSGTDIVG